MSFNVGDTVECNSSLGKVSEVHSSFLVTVAWLDGSDSEIHTSQLRKVYNCHRFNFVIFKNYDGTTTGKVIPRETFQRLMSASE